MKRTREQLKKDFCENPDNPIFQDACRLIRELRDKGITITMTDDTIIDMAYDLQ